MAEEDTHQRRSKMFTLNEVLSHLEDDDTDMASADIYITPPGDGQNSDEDDVNDDVQESVSSNDLPGRQLRSSAQAGVTLRNGTRFTLGDVSDTDESDVTSDAGDSSGDEAGPSVTSRGKRTPKCRTWRKEDLQPNPDEWNEHRPDFLQEDLTATKCFERFFDDFVIQHMVTETLRYAKAKGDHAFNIDLVEMRAFLAILFISGYNDLPRRRMYWEQQDDVINLSISSAMSRNRFETIMRYLHLANNDDLNPNDKYAKVRPLSDLLNKRFMDFFPMEKNLSIDESMIPYYGKNSLKQHIRGKSIRFGYKQWVIATPLGYACHLEPYQGAGSGFDKQFGLGYGVVMGLVDHLPKGPRFHVYFDNFFTSLKLLKGLSDIGISATGTIRTNRTEKCPMDFKSLKKKQRGSFDFRHDREDNLIVCAWNDNSVVTLASNMDTVNPLAKAARWSAHEKKKVLVDQPNLINRYNTNMGGVDRLDQNVGAYRISIRSKKWWWPVFAFLPDVAINNAWLLYRLSPAHGNLALDQLGFKRSVAQTYIELLKIQQHVPAVVQSQQAKRQKVASEVRHSGVGHHLRSMPKQRRCSLCGKKANMLCGTCNVPLHQKCTEQFHS